MTKKSVILHLSALLMLLTGPCTSAIEKAFTIKSSELRMDAEYLAGENTCGRALGTAGHQDAAHYILRRFREVGIKPVSGCNNLSFKCRTSSGMETSTGHNILGMIEGGKSACCRYIVVSTHYDGLGSIDGKIYPGADADVSGVAAILQLAKVFRNLRNCGNVFDYNLLFIAFDARRSSNAGSRNFIDALENGSLVDSLNGNVMSTDQIKLVLSLDQIGSSRSPVVESRKDYLIAIGLESLTEAWQNLLYRANCFYGYRMDMHSDYYGSERFTQAFYDMGDRKVFVSRKLPTMFFTSGITDLTNSTRDNTENLDLSILRRRTILIYNFLNLVMQGE